MSDRRGGTPPALAVLLGAVASMAPGWARVPVPLYDPVGRSFRFARIGAPGGPPVEIVYYGVVLATAAGFLVGGLLGLALERRAGRSRLLDAWALTAVALAAAYQVWTIWP